MSAPRVERVDDLVVDSQGLDPPTDKWLQAAREAADTDGIRENANVPKRVTVNMTVCEAEIARLQSLQRSRGGRM